MTNSALNTRALVASAALLAGASSVERVGVVRRRSEYTQNVQDLVGTRDVRRVVFIVVLHGGIGEDMITIDQTLDPISALIAEGDQVDVNIADSVHLESTVSPVFAWNISDESNPAGRVLRSGEFLNRNGQVCISSLVLGDNGLTVTVQGPKDELAAPSERVGVILKRTVYTREAHRPAATPLIGTTDKQRVSFMVRLDGGIGSELITIDQTLDATAALLKEGDQVSVRLVDHAHVESTVHPVFGWGKARDNATGRILRTGEFLDSKGRPSMASLLLEDGEGRGLSVREAPIVSNRLAA